MLICLLACVASAQQSMSSEWQGEWGAFSPQTSATGQTRYLGQSLYISDCHDRTCHFKIDCQESNAHCDGSGTFEMTGPNAAAATLTPGGREEGHRCTLTIALAGSGAGKSIVVNSSSGDCDYYCTGGGQLKRRFLFRTPGEYYGSDRQACFSDLSKARLAICRNQSLANSENQWINLLEDVQGLKQEGADGRGQVLAAVRNCDRDSDAQACVDTLIQSNIANLRRQKDELLAGITEAGDPMEASRLIRVVVGTYRRTHENGDVQGGTYESKDSLEIKQSSSTSVAFKAHLEFFNGHECNADGVAGFKRAGVFVSRMTGQDKACVFELVPTLDGVKIADPTGQCRMLTCGARGGWVGAGFLFSDR